MTTDPPPTTTRPLHRLRVLDLSRVLAGPFCSMILADLGAEVIKIERPGTGDETRQWGPPFVGDFSAYYLSINRNKRSVTLDLAHPRGQDILRALVERSDVLLENFLPATAAKLGVEPAQLHALNPNLVHCSITGFGRTGAWRDVPGYDFIIQALSGLMSITGEPDGQPMKVGVALTDVLAGLFATVAILSGLLARQRNSVPHEPELPATPTASASSPSPPASPPTLNSQPSTLNFTSFDISLLDCTIASLVNVAQAYLVARRVPPRQGNAHFQVVPYQCFRASDGHFILAVGNDAQWQRFCQAVGRPDLAADERFKTNPLRVQNRSALIPLLEQFLADKSIAWLRTVLHQAEVPHAPILTLDQVFTQEALAGRNLLVRPTGDLQIDLVSSPIRRLGSAPPTPEPPPRLGEHTDAVLRDLLGYSTDQIADLRRQNVI